MESEEDSAGITMACVSLGPGISEVVGVKVIEVVVGVAGLRRWSPRRSREGITCHVEVLILRLVELFR